jgi:hypothetical protein
VRRGFAQCRHLLVAGTRNEQPRHRRPQRGADLVDLPRLLARYDGDGEHAAMTAHDQTLSLQRLQRGANAGAADPEPIDHLAFDKPRPRHEAKREDGLAQGLRAAPCPGVVS